MCGRISGLLRRRDSTTGAARVIRRTGSPNSPWRTQDIRRLHNRARLCMPADTLGGIRMAHPRSSRFPRGAADVLRLLAPSLCLLFSAPLHAQTIASPSGATVTCQQIYDTRQRIPACRLRTVCVARCPHAGTEGLRIAANGDIIGTCLGADTFRVPRSVMPAPRYSRDRNLEVVVTDARCS